MAKTISVKVIDNGPLKITGDGSAAIELSYCGEAVAVEPGKALFLCRCGESSKAPFCDSTHVRNGFVAAPAVGDRKQLSVWEGRTIRTFFNPNTCMHVFHCKPLKALRARELDGDDAAAAEIARVVLSCPSGALSYEARDLPQSPPVQQPQIEIMQGGEVRIQCEFEINAELQERQPSDRATLCRCGLSENKPWCDGRHKQRAQFR